MKAALCGRCKKPASWICRLFLCLLFCSVSVGLILMMSGAVISKYNVLIEDEDQTVTVYTSQEDPEEILDLVQITLGAHDTFDFTGFDENNQGVITVNRASLVTVEADGTKKSKYVTRGTIGDALAQMGVTVGDEDYINVSLSEPVHEDVHVVINRITYNTVTQISEVPFEVKKFPTQTLSEGKTRTLSAGVNGERTTVIKQTLLDGVVVEEETLSDEVTAQPVAARVLVGDPNAPTSQLIPEDPIELDENGNPVEYVSKVTGRATAYSSLGRPTSLVPGNVAMDLSQFPKGTRLYIKTPDGSFTYGYSVVKDTGTAVTTGHCLVDLFFSSYKESCLFGSRTVEVYVLP